MVVEKRCNTCAFQSSQYMCNNCEDHSNWKISYPVIDTAYDVKKTTKTNNKITLELDKDTARELAIWIKLSMFQALREDPYIDNLEWIKKYIKIIDELNEMEWD